MAMSEPIYSFLKWDFACIHSGCRQERSVALPSLLSVLSLLHAQWAGGTVAHSRPHKKASIHSTYNFSTWMFAGGGVVNVGFSQKEI